MRRPQTTRTTQELSIMKVIWRLGSGDTMKVARILERSETIKRGTGTKQRD
jgi:hypothetical protein